MFKQLLLLTFTLFTLSVFSQEEEVVDLKTSKGGEATISFANTGYGDYYAGGGLDNTTVQGLLNLYSSKPFQNGGSWDNSLRVDYGVAKIENTNGNNFTKSSDVLDVISKVGTPIKQSDKWFYSLAFNLLSQLTDTRTLYDAATSDYTQLVGVNGGDFGTNQSGFFSPANVVLGLGVDYKPNENFSAFFGPLTGKVLVVADDLIAESGLYGNDITLDPATNNVLSYENTRFEAGANVLANYNNSFLTNEMLSFSTGLKLFSNYLDKPENIDVNWNTVTTLNPWKFLTLTYTTDLAYDDNKVFTAFANGEPTGGLKRGVQFRNVLGVGVIHKFGDSKE